MADLWQYVKKISSVFQVAHVPSDARDAVTNEFMRFGFADAWLEGARNDCAYGLAFLILLALPRMEQEMGHDPELLNKYYRLFEDLALHSEPEGAAGSEKYGWFLRTHQSESYPMLLGLWPSQGRGRESEAVVLVGDGAGEGDDLFVGGGAVTETAATSRAASEMKKWPLEFTPVADAEVARFLRTPTAAFPDGHEQSLSLSPAALDATQHPSRTMSDTLLGFRELSAKMMNDLRHPTAHSSPIPTLFDVKIYIFDFGKTDEWTTRSLLCSQGMFATEVFLHRWLLHSPYRTADPEEADFFFVPIYPSCIQTKFDKNIDDLNKFYIDALTTPGSAAKYYFERNDGRDFVFLFSSECLDFPKWKKYILRSVFVSVEKTPIECTKDFGYVNEENAEEYGKSCYHCYHCFSPWKDVLIPGFVEKWSIDRMMSKAQQYAKRENLLCYHGADSDEISLYKYANATARNDIQQHLASLPGTSIGRRIPIIMDYFERMGTCVFCLVPKGLGYWSNRFFEIMFLGCIPVILSDDMGLPFADKIPWKEFTIKWPMSVVDKRLIRYLDDLVMTQPDVVEGMHKTMLKHLCWLSWHSQDFECSPYRAVMEQLQAKKRGFPRYSRRFWNTELDSREYAEDMAYPYYRDQMEGGLPEL